MENVGQGRGCAWALLGGGTLGDKQQDGERVSGGKWGLRGAGTQVWGRETGSRDGVGLGGSQDLKAGVRGVPNDPGVGCRGFQRGVRNGG